MRIKRLSKGGLFFCGTDSDLVMMFNHRNSGLFAAFDTARTEKSNGIYNVLLKQHVKHF